MVPVLLVLQAQMHKDIFLFYLYFISVVTQEKEEEEDGYQPSCKQCRI